MTLIALFFILIILALYIIVDLLTKGVSTFVDRWIRRTAWLWLPIYALYALTKDFLKKTRTGK